MVGLTAAGIVATLLIAFLTFRANAQANASRAIADRTQVGLIEAQTAAFNASHAATEEQTAALRELIDRTNGSGVSPDEVVPATDVKWLLERDSARKNGWLVRNVGTATAYGARVRGLTEQDATDLLVQYKDPIDAPPYTAIPFSVWRSLASPAATVVEVTWTDALGRPNASRLVAV